MAIFYLDSSPVKRSEGRSVIAAIAYRSGERMIECIKDDDTGIVSEVIHDYSKRHNILHSEIIAPSSAPEWARDRHALWGKVKDVETRINAQYFQEVKLAIPLECSQEQGIEMVRDYVNRTFVARGMVADFAIHWEKNNPHAHIALTTRDIDSHGKFGKKNRDWHRKADIISIRKAWADIANEHLLKFGYDVKIDHRSYQAQGIEVEPMINLSLAAIEVANKGIETEIEKENKIIALRNIERVDNNPDIILHKLSVQHATFTKQMIAKEVFSLTKGDEISFDRLLHKVMSSDNLVMLQRKDLSGNVRYSYSDYYKAEKSLFNDIVSLSSIGSKLIDRDKLNHVLSNGSLSDEQKKAVEYLTDSERDVVVLIGKAGTGKTSTLRVVSDYYKSLGYNVKGGALSGIASDNLDKEAGVSARTIASWRMHWDGENREKNVLSRDDVFILDEAGMVDTRELQYVVENVKRAGAKLILVGDPDQLQPIAAGQAFRGVYEKLGGVEINKVWRQKEEWQRGATEQLARGEVGLALEAYDKHESFHFERNYERATVKLVQDYVDGMVAEPQKSRLVLAYTSKDVNTLNRDVRDKLISTGILTAGKVYKTHQGEYEFSKGDRVIFLKNDYTALNVRNGTTGSVVGLAEDGLVVKLDQSERVITVKSSEYNHIAHGYACTVHKSQGVTVDKSYVLAGRYFDNHAMYVACSRHRESLSLYVDSEEFKDLGALAQRVERGVGKDLVADYEDVTYNNQHFEGVRRYQQQAAKAIDMIKSFGDWADMSGQPISSHADWANFVDVIAERNDLAKSIINDMRSHRKYVKEAGIYLGRLRVHAGLERDMTPSERQEAQKIEQFVEKFKGAAELWQTIRKEAKFSAVREHPLYAEFDSVRQERNAVAKELVDSCVRNHSLHHGWLKEHGLSWKQVTYCSDDFVKRFNYEPNADYATKHNALIKGAMPIESLKEPENREFAHWAYEQISRKYETYGANKQWISAHQSNVMQEKELITDRHWQIDIRKQLMAQTYSDPDLAMRRIEIIGRDVGVGALQAQVMDNPSVLGKLLYPLDTSASKSLAEQITSLYNDIRHLTLAEEGLAELESSKKYVSIYAQQQYLEVELGRFAHSQNLEQLAQVIGIEVANKGIETEIEKTVVLEEGVGSSQDAIMQNLKDIIPVLDAYIELKDKEDSGQIYDEQYRVFSAKEKQAIADKERILSRVAEDQQKIIDALKSHVKQPERVIQALMGGNIPLVAENLLKAELLGTSAFGMKNDARKQAEGALVQMKDTLKELEKAFDKVTHHDRDIVRYSKDKAELEKKILRIEEDKKERQVQMAKYADLLQKTWKSVDSKVLASAQEKRVIPDDFVKRLTASGLLVKTGKGKELD